MREKKVARLAEVFQEGLGSRVDGWQSMKTGRRWKLLSTNGRAGGDVHNGGRIRPTPVPPGGRDRGGPFFPSL